MGQNLKKWRTAVNIYNKQQAEGVGIRLTTRQCKNFSKSLAENTDISFQASKEIGLKASTSETKYMRIT
jgi:hypothetical protein